MSIPFIDLGAQYRSIKQELGSAVEGVLDSHHYVLGKKGADLEAEVAKRTGCKYAIGVASGTDALILSLKAVGIGPGDEVITSPFTFFATAGAVSLAGAKPVFSDIDSAAYNLDPSQIERHITKKTKAIIPVHLYGLSCDMAPILKIAKRHSLSVIEDAAQAFGAEYHGRKVGSFGTAGCFSFYPTKNLGCAGDGGMVTTSSKRLAEKLRLFRVYGSKKKYHHDFIGNNSRLDEMQAAILLVKLKYIDRWNALRNQHADSYRKGLNGLPVQPPVTPRGSKHVYHLYSVATKKREALAMYLKKEGIGSGIYYPLPLHLQPCYKSLGYKRGDFPVSESVASKILSLPMYAELQTPDRNRVISTIQKFFSEITSHDESQNR